MLVDEFGDGRIVASRRFACDGAQVGAAGRIDSLVVTIVINFAGAWGRPGLKCVEPGFVGAASTEPV